MIPQATIEQIAAAPQKMREAVAGLTPRQLETPYREGGWTLRQVVHHVPDSHMNSYVRFKLALTEQTPTIRPYAAPAATSCGVTSNMPPSWALRCCLGRCTAPSSSRGI